MGALVYCTGITAHIHSSVERRSLDSKYATANKVLLYIVCVPTIEILFRMDEYYEYLSIEWNVLWTHYLLKSKLISDFSFFHEFSPIIPEWRCANLENNAQIEFRKKISTQRGTMFKKIESRLFGDITMRFEGRSFCEINSTNSSRVIFFFGSLR